MSSQGFRLVTCDLSYNLFLPQPSDGTPYHPHPIHGRQTPEVYQTLKLISRPGTEKIIRYAFEFTKRNGRKKITCLT